MISTVHKPLATSTFNAKVEKLAVNYVDLSYVCDRPIDIANEDDSINLCITILERTISTTLGPIPANSVDCCGRGRRGYRRRLDNTDAHSHT
jgi:hypothetical protein